MFTWYTAIGSPEKNGRDLLNAMVRYNPSYGRGKYFLIFNYSLTGLPYKKARIKFNNYRQVTRLASDMSGAKQLVAHA